MSPPTALGKRLAMVHLGFGLLCVLLAVPYLAAGVQAWWQSVQFADFGPYVEVLRDAALDSVVKGLLCAVGATYFFWRWRALLRQA